MRARDLSPSPLDCCRPLTFFPAPLIYLLFNPVLFLWKEFLYEGTARFQSAQDSGEGKSNVEEGQGGCLAEVKAHLAEWKKLWWDGALCCWRPLRE